LKPEIKKGIDEGEKSEEIDEIKVNEVK